MISEKRAFLISIDTEGDNIWARPEKIFTQNASYLERFQGLCDRHGFKPTYLTNYEMALDHDFLNFGREVLKSKSAEIGMHLHAWDTPPLKSLSPKDWYNQPYATEFPSELIHRKASYLTRLLEDRFQTVITSHRAGRWGFSASYARTLVELGYEVDCSVTPGVSWSNHIGHPGGSGGVDFRNFPAKAYRLDLQDIARPGGSTLVELPMTIVVGKRPLYRQLARRLMGRKGPRLDWLSPKGDNLDLMLKIVAQAAAKKWPYIQFTLHSSEFMPGGSPTFADEASIEALYCDLESLFANISKSFVGMTLTEYKRKIYQDL